MRASALPTYRWPAASPRFRFEFLQSAPNFSVAHRKAFAAAQIKHRVDLDSSLSREPDHPAHALTPEPFRRPIRPAARANWHAPLSPRLRRRARRLAPFHANASTPKPPGRNTRASTKKTKSAVRGSPASPAKLQKIPARPRFPFALSPARPPGNPNAPDWPAPSPPAPGSTPASINLPRACTSLAHSLRARLDIRNLRSAATRSPRHLCSRSQPQCSMQTEKPCAPLRHSPIPPHSAQPRSRVSLVRGPAPAFQPASGPLPTSPALPSAVLHSDTNHPDSKSPSTVPPYR